MRPAALAAAHALVLKCMYVNSNYACDSKDRLFETQCGKDLEGAAMKYAEAECTCERLKRTICKKVPERTLKEMDGTRTMVTKSPR